LGCCNKITLFINGSLSKTEPVIINGTSYIPLRAAAEALNVEVIYNQSSKTIYLNKKEIVVPQASEPLQQEPQSKPQQPQPQSDGDNTDLERRFNQ